MRQQRWISIAGGNAPGYYPSFPEKLAARITVSYPQVETSGPSQYPPARKVMDVRYDRSLRSARVDILQGHDAMKTFVMLYNEKEEYMVRHGEFAACQRSYLSEPFPDISFPPGLKYAGKRRIEARRLSHEKQISIDADVWVHSGHRQPTVEILYDPSRRIPLRAEVRAAADGGVISTYAIAPMAEDAQMEQDDFMPQAVDPKKCVRHVGGFPYVHAFSPLPQIVKNIFNKFFFLI